ncbi:MAG TPA: hypothetical protein VFO36_12785, partial [Nitrospiraceae bacterium]|nr:hypothetical protein [Nitrospiraceae bacterium]
MRKLIWMVWSWTAGALVLTAYTPVQAQQPAATSPAGRSVELAVSDEALQLRYLSDANVIGKEDSDLNYGLLLTEERDVVASATLLLDKDVRLMPRLSIQFGPQAYIALLSEENEDVFALAFG